MTMTENYLEIGIRARRIFQKQGVLGHVDITVLSLLLERTVEHACGDTWRNVSDRLRRIQLAQLLSPHGSVWQVTDPTPEAAKEFSKNNMNT